jgi:coenzyme F420-reducing hydrogenase delta subunit
MSITKKFLEYLGIEPQRVTLSWVSASEAGKLTELLGEMTKGVKEIGPNRLFADEI